MLSSSLKSRRFWRRNVALLLRRDDPSARDQSQNAARALALSRCLIPSERNWTAHYPGVNEPRDGRSRGRRPLVALRDERLRVDRSATQPRRRHVDRHRAEALKRQPAFVLPEEVEEPLVVVRR